MEGLFELLQKGGLAVYFLLFLSLVSWAVIVERLVNMRMSNLVGRSLKDLKALLASQDIQGAIKLLSTDGSPVGMLLRSLLEEYEKSPTSKNELYKRAEFELSLLVPKVEKNLLLLSTIASIAPLVGLFGTITGLIKVFSAFATADPNRAINLLSAGISEALVSAAVGLAVAIPSLVAYWLFRIWGNNILDKIEEEVYELLRLLK